MATRQTLEMRKDALIARIQSLNREKAERIRTVTSSPTFDPFDRDGDAQHAQLVQEQNELIGSIHEIDRLLGG